MDTFSTSTAAASPLVAVDGKVLLVFLVILVTAVIGLRNSFRAKRAEQIVGARRETVRRLHEQTSTSAVYVPSRGKFEAIFKCSGCGSTVRSTDPAVLDHLKCTGCAANPALPQLTVVAR